MMLPVDMPWQTEKELLRLFEFSALDYDVLAFINDGFLQPLSALYRRERAGFWEKRLQAEELSLYRGILELRWQAIEISTSKSWVNLNYLEDLLLHQVSISNPS
jgi:molybdopterin-guanine dinucleotide biosynthesis protein A